MSKEIQLKTGNDNVYPHPFWPIGSIYISVTNTNPSTYFGGTWQRFGQGKCIVGVNESETEFNTVQKTGGAKTVGLSIANIPSHNHGLTINTTSLTGSLKAMAYVNHTGSGIFSTAKDTANKNGGSSGTTFGGTTYTLNASHNHSGSVGYTGSGTAHNNLQPYITVYMWRRTA